MAAVKDYYQTYPLERLERGIRSLDSVQNLVGAIYDTDQDLHTVNPDLLAELLGIIVDDMRAALEAVRK